ncbi:MAG: hypothetical protein AAF985_19055 [Bacteroidota bacterium]
MNVLRFKTNIESNSRVADVSDFIDRVNNIKNWEVNVASPDKILVVRGRDLRPSSVVGAVKKAGFTIEPIAD